MLTPAETVELEELFDRVWERHPETGQYYHWTPDERDRVHELMRKRDPAIRFAPSTEEMARRFGDRSARGS